jgi:NTE family protein
MLVHATGLMVAQRFAADAMTFAGRANLTVLPPPCPIDVAPTDFGHADELMARAEADARAFLDGRRRSVVPIRRRAARRRPEHLDEADLPPAS